LVARVENRCESREDVPSPVEVPELLPEKHPGTNGGGSRQASVDVVLDAAEVLDRPVGSRAPAVHG
jgi:hypothetical protein